MIENEDRLLMMSNEPADFDLRSAISGNLDLAAPN